ncbi:MAG: type phosphodiesterase/nucleotide pyrophosphatase [Firmicutes bacterium]|nr:type phosphodiesterase/nucleotide pyrophosphatase [Bacillota bacterium]
MKCENKAQKAIMLGLDGADPVLMQRFFSEGYLPNLQKVVEMGAAREDLSMLGAMPTITPPNWASLSTGAWPGTHGITCFWNHTSGKPLLELEHGFNSKLSEAEFIWDAADRAGKKSIVFNYPTGWPASNENLIVVDGTGINANTKGFIDFEKIYRCKAGAFPVNILFHDGDQSGVNCMVEGEVDVKQFDVDTDQQKPSDQDLANATPGGGKIQIGANSRVTKEVAQVDYVDTAIKPCKGWKNEIATAREVVLPVNTGNQVRYGLLIAEDGVNYNKLEIYTSKKDEKPIGVVYSGQWSDWIYDSFKIDGREVPVAYKLKIMQLAKDASEMDLYYSFALDLESQKYFHPHELGPKMYKEVGPMVHMSNCGLDDIQIETQAAMYEWYGKALKYLTSNNEWALLYAHAHALDFCNHNYQCKVLEEYGPNYKYYLYDVVLKYYEMSDKLVGDVLAMMDEDTVLFITSDHGGMSKEFGCEIPLLGDPWSVGGKLFEDMGYLVIKRDEKGKAEIDWDKTTAISQRSGYIYVNLKGREPHGCVEPEQYDELVEKIIDDLMTYRDPENGRRPFALALRKQDMPIIGLGGDHVGDVYFTFNPNWTRVHGTSLTTHEYKGTSVNCLFMMTGAGVKKGEKLKRTVRIVDVVPTICELTGIPTPANVEGGVIYQGLEG